MPTPVFSLDSLLMAAKASGFPPRAQSRPPRRPRSARQNDPGGREWRDMNDPKHPESKPARRACHFPARGVVVKLIDQVHLPYDSGDRLGRCLFDASPAWRRIAEQFADLRVESVFGPVAEQVDALIARARAVTPSYRPPRFENFVRVTPGELDDPEALAAALRECPSVEVAHVEPLVRTTGVPMASDDPLWPAQDHLDPAPAGIGAECAWMVGGGTGQGVQVCDIEFAWALDHEDLIAANISFLAGIQSQFHSTDHGTAVMGIIVGSDNAVGGVGIAPDCDGRVSGFFVSSGGGGIASAVTSAAAGSSLGDVILIELAISFGSPSPFVAAEAEATNFAAIQLATAAGVNVIECAGNDAADLDAYTTPAGDKPFDLTHPSYQDSGALIVGASIGAPPHGRASFSNHGARVNCFAHGLGVTTSSGPTLQSYTSFFNGTSSAGAIVAGGAAIVQGIRLHHGAAPWTPTTLRAMFSDAVLNTPSASAGDRIGVMPDLCAIVSSGMGMSIDVFVRDFVGDTGLPHTNGGAWASPDVIVRPNAVPNPQAAFGQGSGTVNSNTLGSEVEIGQDNYVYVRAANRGTLTLYDVTARVYVIPSTTLALPSSWTLVGTTVIPEIPFNGDVVVSDAIVWPAASIPSAGHHCFVCVLDHPLDPAPSPTAITTFSQFVDYVRDQNNVAWRNFNLVNVVPPQPPQTHAIVELAFAIAGAPDVALPFRFELLSRLPADARVQLEVPRALARALGGGRETAHGKSSFPLLSLGKHALPAVELPAGFEGECRLTVTLPGEALDRSYPLAIRQLQGELEVGRVTWTLRPTEPREPSKPSKLGTEPRRRARRRGR